MAPRSQRNWHPIWHRSQRSWFRHYSDFEYHMWDDKRIWSFISDQFPRIAPILEALPLQIVVLDVARYMLLFRFGGLYADMDMFCYKNFHAELERDVHIIEGASGT